MITKILVAFAILAVVLVLVVSLQPAEFRITRLITIAAPPEAVFPHVNDFHQWQAWSPWAKMDPTMKQSFEGPQAGVGSSYSWAGNNQVGEGRMTIIDSRPGQLVRTKLEFFKPFAATNEADFTFQEQGGKTLVTWSMTGRNNFLAKAANLVMNMDKMVGGQFDQGLAGIKTIVETK